MTGNAVINLGTVQESFFDRLSKIEKQLKNPELDPEEAAEKRLELIKAAKAAIESGNSPEAKKWYALCLVTGEHGFPVNVEEGIKLLNEAVMMRAMGAHENLGDIYSGEIIALSDDRLDLDKAIKHYEQADNGYAEYRLARIYSEQPAYKDLRKALDYAERSGTHSGDDMGKCLWAMWKYYGDWVVRDCDGAYELFKEVHDRGRNENGDFKNWAASASYFFMGLMTYYGEAVAQEEHKGFVMIEEAASQGDGYAREWLDNYYGR